jgi:hypothetical protein
MAIFGKVQRSGVVSHGKRVTISRSVGERMGPKNEMVNRKIDVVVENRIEIFQFPFR